MGSTTQLKALMAASIMSLASFGAQADFDEATAAAVQAAIAGEHRSDANKARDMYRKPAQVLEFLGFRSDMTVIEIWPGGGWYSEILAPALQADGKFYAAQYHANAKDKYGFQRQGLGTFLSKLGKHNTLYQDVEVTEFYLPYHLEIAPRGTADMILTFRSVHNLVGELYASGAYAELAFKAWYDALKPNGVLGVVDHQWDDPTTEDPLSRNGYISVERTIALAESAGFKLVDSSELLHNPKDTKDHGFGVWSLAPAFAEGEASKQKYAPIGESDRYLLKFVKPE